MSYSTVLAAGERIGIINYDKLRVSILLLMLVSNSNVQRLQFCFTKIPTKPALFVETF